MVLVFSGTLGAGKERPLVPKGRGGFNLSIKLSRSDFIATQDAWRLISNINADKGHLLQAMAAILCESSRT